MSHSPKFERRVLKFGQQSLPPSLPLIIPSNKEWVMNLDQLVEHDDLSEEEMHSDSTASLKVVPEALEVFKSIDKPVAILSICGPFRTGKSYLLSHILGCPGVFRVGHGMGACTKGVWMATTVLECDKFVVVALDTEGIDSPDGEEADVSKLLIVTTLLSSFLIYNSQTVPEWNDLEDLSCFSQLSSLIATRNMSEEQYDAISDDFPNFLWLVRDALDLPLINGQRVSPTEYLKTQVLVRSSNDRSTNRDEIVSAILRLFPSVECRTLPRPSADPNIVTTMETNHDLLEPTFKEELSNLVSYIRSRVRVKKKNSSMQCNTGAVWAEIVEKYVSSVNGNSELVLENMYISAAEAALLKLSQKLVAEYNQGMEVSVESKFPLEVHGDQDDQPETLLFIHNRVMGPILERFQREIEHFLPGKNNPSVEQRRQKMLFTFQGQICQQSENGAVVDGALYCFAVRNYTASRLYCQQVELEVFRGVRQKIQQARNRQSESNSNIISSELLAAEQNYYQQAIGPAKFEVCNEVRKKLQEDSEDLIQNVPGKPKDLLSTGASNDKIKLQWVETSTNPGVVNFYEVFSMSDNANWSAVPGHFPNQSAVIEKLKPGTKYLFKVRGVGVTGLKGNFSDPYTCSTTVGSVVRGAATVSTFFGGMALCPAAGVLSIPIGGPLAVVGGVLGAPIIAGALARQVSKHFGPQGELSTSSGNATSESATPANELDDPSPRSSGNIQHSASASETVSTTETISIVYESDD